MAGPNDPFPFDLSTATSRSVNCDSSPIVSNRNQSPPGIMDLAGTFDGPAPVVYVPGVVEAVGQNALRLKSRPRGPTAPAPEETSGNVCFIVPEQPEDVAGVVSAVYADLIHGNPDADIQLDATVPCINVVAPSLEDAMRLIQTAQDLADDYLSPSSAERRKLFVEPPAGTAGDIRVIIGHDAAVGGVSYRLQAAPKGANAVAEAAVSPYTEKVAETLHRALQQASILSSSLALRAKLGIYRLHKFRPGSYTLTELQDMVAHPKATGEFDARLGAPQATEKFNIDVMRNVIRAAGTALGPTDNQTPTAAHVLPSHILEVCDDDWRYEANLEAVSKGDGNKQGGLVFTLLPAHVFPRASPDPVFEIISMAVGRELDWEIAAVSSHKISETSGQCQLVQKALTGATSEIRGPHEDHRSYPVVRLEPAGYTALHGKLTSVVMKSKYRFSWKTSGYMVQLTIIRQWKDLYRMLQSHPEDAGFELSIYGDNWDQDSKARAGETVGKIWGDDLEGLLLDESGKTAFGRVQGLVRTVRDIRDFFDDASRVEK